MCYFLLDGEDESWAQDSWTWKTEFGDANETSDTVSDDWIQTCLITASQQSEVLVIANQDRYVVLSCNNYFRLWLQLLLYHVFFCFSSKVGKEKPGGSAEILCNLPYIKYVRRTWVTI